MIIVKCDNCKKIIPNNEIEENQYGGLYNYVERIKGMRILCNRCKVHLSEQYQEKYEELKESFQKMDLDFRKLRKECRNFKIKTKKELLQDIEINLK